jgi:hypothetical protein
LPKNFGKSPIVGIVAGAKKNKFIDPGHGQPVYFSFDEGFFPQLSIRFSRSASLREKKWLF